MSRKLSLLLCLVVLMFGATSVIAEAAAATDAKTQVSTARCGKCGDGSCVKSCGETPESCPIDCGVPAPAAVEAATSACGSCGDGWCVAMCGETAESCPADCGKIKPTVELQQSDDCQPEEKP